MFIPWENRSLKPHERLPHGRPLFYHSLVVTLAGTINSQTFTLALWDGGHLQNVYLADRPHRYILSKRILLRTLPPQAYSLYRPFTTVCRPNNGFQSLTRASCITSHLARSYQSSFSMSCADPNYKSRNLIICFDGKRSDSFIPSGSWLLWPGTGNSVWGLLFKQ